MHLEAFNPDTELRAIYLGGRFLGFKKPNGQMLSLGTLPTRPRVYMQDDKLVVASTDRAMLDKILEFAGMKRVEGCEEVRKDGQVCGKPIKTDGLCWSHLALRARKVKSAS